MKEQHSGRASVAIINKNELLAWRFAPMPEIVRRSPRLSDGAKILYNEIVSYIWQKNESKTWASQETLASNLSISRQTVSNRLKELAAVGLIEIRRRGLNKSNEIYLLRLDGEALGVEEGEKGSFKPAPGADVKNSLHQDVKDSLHQDVKNLIKVEGVRGGESPRPERVSEIRGRHEEESSEEESSESESPATTTTEFFSDSSNFSNNIQVATAQTSENSPQPNDSETVVGSVATELPCKGPSQRDKPEERGSSEADLPKTKPIKDYKPLRSDALLKALRDLDKRAGIEYNLLDNDEEVKENGDDDRIFRRGCVNRSVSG